MFSVRVRKVRETKMFAAQLKDVVIDVQRALAQFGKISLLMDHGIGPIPEGKN